MKKNLITLMALVACAVSVSNVDATQQVYSVPSRADIGANRLATKLQYVAPTRALAVKNAVKTNAQTVGGKFVTANTGAFAPGAQLNLSTGGMVQGANVATGDIASRGKSVTVQGLTGTNLRGALAGLTGTAGAGRVGITTQNEFNDVYGNAIGLNAGEGMAFDTASYVAAGKPDNYVPFYSKAPLPAVADRAGLASWDDYYNAVNAGETVYLDRLAWVAAGKPSNDLPHFYKLKPNAVVVAAQPGILVPRTATNTFARVQDHDVGTDGMMNVVLTGTGPNLGNTALTHNKQTMGGSLQSGGISSIGKNLAFVGNNGINS